MNGLSLFLLASSLTQLFLVFIIALKLDMIQAKLKDKKD